MVCGTGYGRRPRDLRGVSKRLASAEQLWESDVCWNDSASLMCHLALEMVKFSESAVYESLS